MNKLELKVPPVVQVFLNGFFMWFISRHLIILEFDFPYKKLGFIVAMVLGIIISILGVISFRFAKTTVNPTNLANASSLVTSGIFRVTRNPMYLGMLFILIGWAYYLSNPLSFFFCAFFVVYMNRFQIMPEERVLAKLFGDVFIIYCKNVRRWM